MWSSSPTDTPPLSQDQVVAGRRAAHGVLRGVQPVGHDAQVDDLAAGGLQQAAQREAVGVVDGTGLQRLAGHHQFVAGGKQRHARLARTVSVAAPTDAARPSACGVSRLPGSSTVAPCGTSSPRRRIHWPGCGTVLTRTRPGPRRPGLALLLHHHRGRRRRHLRAGEDARRRAARQRLADHAGRDALRHRQHGAGGRHVGGVQRIAVHRGVVLGRHVQRDTTGAASTRPSASKVETVSVSVIGCATAPASRRASASSSVSSGRWSAIVQAQWLSM
jgi:hypothetical protein